MANSAPKRTGLSPFCRHLTSKKMILAAEPPLEASDVLDASQHCWCAKTQTVLGPDRFACHPEDCEDRERDCFESRFGDLT